MSGLAPFKSCRARFTASITSSKRLELSCKQSSTVIRAIRNDIPSGHSTQETSCSWEPAAKGSRARVFTNFARPAVYRMLGRKLNMKVKPFCFHKAEGANNHIKHGDTCIFARNPIGVTNCRPTAMFTSVIHDYHSLANKMPHRDYFCCQYSTGNSVALTDSEVILSTQQR